MARLVWAAHDFDLPSGGAIGASSMQDAQRFENLERNMDELLRLTRLRVADWLTIEHAALVCDCSYDHVYRAVERGDLPAANIGNGEKKAAYRIARSELNGWMERHKSRTVAVPPRAAMSELVNRHLPGFRDRKASDAS